jgi:hypothetical protein
MLTIERPNANLQKGFSEYAGRSMDRPVAVLPRRDSPTVDGTGAKERRYPGQEARNECHPLCQEPHAGVLEVD